MATREVGTQTVTFYMLVQKFELLHKRVATLEDTLEKLQTQIDTQKQDLLETITNKHAELTRQLNSKADVSAIHINRDGFGTVGRLESRVSALERSMWASRGWR